MKNIHVSHSTAFDFKNELYVPLSTLTLPEGVYMIFPHADSSAQYPVKEKLLAGEIQLVIAEVSFPSTGQGIELGWADIANVRIVCVYKADAKFSGALRVVASDFISYENVEDLKVKLEPFLKI